MPVRGQEPPTLSFQPQPEGWTRCPQDPPSPGQHRPFEKGKHCRLHPLGRHIPPAPQLSLEPSVGQAALGRSGERWGVGAAGSVVQVPEKQLGWAQWGVWGPRGSRQD